MKKFIAGWEGNKVVVSAMVDLSASYPIYTEAEGGTNVFYMSPAQDKNFTAGAAKAMGDTAEHEFRARGLVVTTEFI